MCIRDRLEGLRSLVAKAQEVELEGRVVRLHALALEVLFKEMCIRDSVWSALEGEADVYVCAHKTGQIAREKGF